MSTELQQGCDCPPRRGLSRRRFLGGAGALAAGLALAPAITRTAYAAGAAPGDVLVVVDLRGGMDGLSLVAPVGDPDYASLRPTIAIPASSGIATGDRMFALHPALEPLVPFWQAGTFGALHAVAQPDETRSHFTSQYELDRAAPGTNLETGWVDRALASIGGTSLMTAATIGSGIADRLQAGPVPAYAARSLADFTLSGAGATGFADAVGALYDASPLPWASVGRPALGAVQTAATAAAIAPGNGVTYPTSDLGAALADVARLIKAGVGLRFAAVDLGDWDMHQNLGAGGTGQMATQVGTLAAALAAFANDLGPTAMKGVSVVTISEFGRRAAENGSGGVDHGHGNALLFLGGSLHGGQVLGRWPGLADADLDQGDLAGTTDYRDVFADLLTTRCGLPTSSLSSIFPGYAPVATGIA